MNLKDHNKFNSDFLDGKHASNSANNVPVLDENAKIPLDQLPTGITKDTVSLGNHKHDDVYYTETEMDEMIAILEENTNTNINSAISDAKNEVLTEVDDGYVSKTVYNDFESNTTLQLDEMVNSTDSRFTEVNENINSLNEQLEQYKSTMGESIRSDGNTINIGDSNNSSFISIGDGKISFIGNNQEAISMTGNEVLITHVRIQDSVRIGNFKFIPRSMGGLSFKFSDDENYLKSGEGWNAYFKHIITATKDDNYVYTDMKANLEAGGRYVFTMDTDGTWGGESGTDTVEAFLSTTSNGQNGTHIQITTLPFEFDMDTNTTWYLRLDVNKNGCTHSFWNMRIERIN